MLTKKLFEEHYPNLFTLATLQKKRYFWCSQLQIQFLTMFIKPYTVSSDIVAKIF